jgi:enamine deaminase RidA (YjgF/YER057c/UK114 family)
MERRLISSESPFEHSGGYSRAVAVDQWVFVSATSGYDYASMTISEDVVEQTRRALRNIEAALNQAGTSLKDVVRVQIFAADPDDWPRISGVFAEIFREIRPALTATVCGMIVPRIKLEIEAVALKT